MTSIQISFIKTRPSGQLMKWIGNKYRFAEQIVKYFPEDVRTYYEPFVGTGAILATYGHNHSVAGDTLSPLIELWKEIQTNPEKVKQHYLVNWEEYSTDRAVTYQKVKDRFNLNPNGLDLLLISRMCYGGVLRFTKEGKISTPIGPHNLMKPNSFNSRVDEWGDRVKNTRFLNSDYKDLFAKAEKKDLIYCDPPYKDSQTILYGAQDFKLEDLFQQIHKAKQNGAYIALSIDGIKKSGNKKIDLSIPNGLFEREVFINNGSSMLRRFQKSGETMIGENVKDRLLLTW